MSSDAKRPPSARYTSPVVIGRGGMGTIRRVLDTVLQRQIALKTITSDASTGAAVRFLEEAQITGQLDHPNIVPVYDLGKTREGSAFYTMKLVGGRTLGEVITDLHAQNFEADALERVIWILIKVCEGVSFAHSRGVLHRDLKPANVMIGSHGEVYVMDWGLALLRDPPANDAAADLADDVTQAPGRHIRVTARPAREFGGAGTISYMAPEQAASDLDALDPRTDVFALGAVLYHILTGWPPYSGGDADVLRQLAREVDITPPQEAVGAQPLPPGLCEIAMKAMAPDPAERHQTVAALRTELEAFLRGGGWFATRTFAAGETIVAAGEPADAAYVVARGRCDVLQDRDGHPVRLRELKPGDVFGETALLSEKPRTATVVAKDDVTVKVITPEAFARELDGRSWVGALVKQLTERFLELEASTGASSDGAQGV